MRDRVKEALFNILAGDVIDSTWWDVFGGTGAIGIEALSRGASFVRFSDLHAAAVQTMNENLQHCKLTEGADVRRGDAFTMLAAPADRAFDFVYVAPPQYQGLWQKAMRLIDSRSDWLSAVGTVIVQMDPSEYEEVALLNLIEAEQRKYGSTLLAFYDRA